MTIGKIFLLLGAICIGNASFSQVEDSTKRPIDSTQKNSPAEINKDTVLQLQISPVQPKDTGMQAICCNQYGDLLVDDPAYNKKYPVWIPAARVILQNGFTWVVDKNLFHYSWSDIGPKTWKNNLRLGWEWDNDRFSVNFVGHPYSGSGYFNIARANGYSYFASLPFAVEGSVMWEYFGENTRPSYNDIINTPISGMFLGEVLYRISSNILDDRSRGAERVFREIFATIVDPARGMSRLTQGKMFRVTSTEVYKKDRLNVTLFVGIHKVDDGTKFWSGSTNSIFNLQLDYGNPFENIHRKPFDFFRVRAELKYGDDTKILDNITGYGILFGRNIHDQPHGMLFGIFQNYDYWNNKTFELGSIGFGAGLVTRMPIGNRSNIFTTIHLAGVPLAGNSTRFGPDTSEYRDYNFGGGLEGKIESTINMGDWVSLGLNGYYYWIHTYVGFPGNSLVGILKPRITVKLVKNLSIGFEQHYYFNNRTLNGLPTAHINTWEQKLFLQLFLEDRYRRGKYH